jgi:hypothetical protein
MEAQENYDKKVGDEWKHLMPLFSSEQEEHRRFLCVPAYVAEWQSDPCDIFAQREWRIHFGFGDSSDRSPDNGETDLSNTFFDPEQEIDVPDAMAFIKEWLGSKDGDCTSKSTPDDTQSTETAEIVADDGQIK